MVKRRFVRLAVVLAAAATAHGACHAESGNPLTDRLSLSAGTFFLDTSTTVRVDGATRRGTQINMEDELGLQNTDRFRADAFWRFAPRHKVRAMYFDTRQSASRRIDRDFVFRGTTYPISTEVASELKTSVAELAYEYAFLRRERYEISGSLGAHHLEFDLGLSSTGASQSASLSTSASASGPLPVVGLHGTWRLTDTLSVEAQAQYFKISIDPYDGRLEDYTASLVWRPFRHVAFGAGYNEFVTRLDVSGGNYEGRLRWRYGGARVFINVAF